MNKDQKRAATVAAVGGGGLFLLYRHQNKNAQTGHGAPPVTNAGAFGQVAPYTPQDPVTLDPGSSVYDPNSENLLNTPTAGPPTFGDSPDFFSSGAWQGGQATAPSAPNYVVKVNYARRPHVHGKRTPHRHHPMGVHPPRHRHRKVRHG